MKNISLDKFRDNLSNLVDRVVSTNAPLKVKLHKGAAFIVVSASDWERDQETLYVLQNDKLMKQISSSYKTHFGEEFHHRSSTPTK